MSRPIPYNLTIGEDGLSVRCEWDAHYLTDEQLETVRKHVETLQAENAKLREQLEGIVGRSFRTADKMACLQAENERLREMLDLVPDCGACEAMLDCDECLRADASQKERKWLDYENAKLRELCSDMAEEMRGLGVDFKRVGWCDYADQMREFGIEVD